MLALHHTPILRGPTISYTRSVGTLDIIVMKLGERGGALPKTASAYVLQHIEGLQVVGGGCCF